MANDDELWERLEKHVGHSVCICTYGNADIVDICLECEDCNEVVLSAADYTITPRRD